jgi:hypothetical protein
MISSDEWNPLIVFEFSQQRKQLGGIRYLVATDKCGERVEETGRVERLVLARDRDIEYPDELIPQLSVFIGEDLRVLVHGVIEPRRPLLPGPLQTKLGSTEM